MLETFRQIYVLASSTLSKIFDELNKYKKCSDDAPRHRSIFDRETLRLGFGLGMCHHALSQFGKAPVSCSDFVSRFHHFSGYTDTRFSHRILVAFTIYLLP